MSSDEFQRAGASTVYVWYGAGQTVPAELPAAAAALLLRVHGRTGARGLRRLRDAGQHKGLPWLHGEYLFNRSTRQVCLLSLCAGHTRTVRLRDALLQMELQRVPGEKGKKRTSKRGSVGFSQPGCFPSFHTLPGVISQRAQKNPGSTVYFLPHFCSWIH